MSQLTCFACGRTLREPATDGLPSDAASGGFGSEPASGDTADGRRCPRCGAPLHPDRRDADRRLVVRRHLASGPTEADRRQAERRLAERRQLR